jgi:DNA-binding transcriptional MerR regulator
MNEETYSIEDLARLGGVSRRTVRYYVQRGLIPAPHGTGRGNHYGPAHLEALIQVRQWQEEGRPLAEIERLRAGLPEDNTAPAAPRSHGEPWLRIKVAEGVELHLAPSALALGPDLDRVIEATRRALLERPHKEEER